MFFVDDSLLFFYHLVIAALLMNKNVLVENWIEPGGQIFYIILSGNKKLFEIFHKTTK